MRAMVGPGPSTAPARLRPYRSDLPPILVLAAVYVIAARLGLQVALVAENVSPVWPPTGIALVAFLLLGRRLWPGVALGALLVNLPILESPLAAVITAAGNTLAPLLAATLLRWVGFRLSVDRVRDAVSLVFLAALLSMTVSATIGTAALALGDSLPAEDVLTAWTVWWAGDAMGVLIVAPFLLVLPRLGELDGSWLRTVELGALLATLIVVTGIAVFEVEQPRLFLIPPLLGWIAWRFQLPGAAPAALIASALATWAAVEGRGPFSGAPLREEMLTLQAFNSTVAFVAIFFSALVTERIRAKEAADHLAADLADTLQRAFLPRELPEVEDLRMAARYIPAGSDAYAGGDWYDVIPLNHDSVGIVVGDVSGHGLGASSVMVQAKMALRAYAKEGFEPAAVVSLTDHLLQEMHPGELVTLVYLEIAPAKGRALMVNAGHPPPLLLEPDGDVRTIDAPVGHPLGVGMEPEFAPTEEVLDLVAGSTLVLYTDGLIDRHDLGIVDGLEHLTAAVADADAADPASLLDGLVSRLIPDPISDDVALVAIGFDKGTEA